jgi:hypothetical protein
MKKFLIAAVALMLSTGSFALDPGKIDEKFLQSFRTNFPDAKEVNWSDQQQTYMVTFIKEGIRSRVIYPKDGSYIHLTRYYNEQNLPFHLRYQVKEEYPGQHIYGIVEVSTISGRGKNLAMEYYIKLEDNRNWTTVKIDSYGDLAIVDKYRKI